MARPSKYETDIKDNLVLVEGWARDGLTNDQIAQNIGISTKTLYEWQNKHSEFRNALKSGKEVVDRQVENALLKSALGYKYTEEAVSNKGEVVEVTKYEKPNTTAIIFWLKNRKPKEWRDKQNLELEGQLDQNITLTKEEKEKKIKDLKERLDDIYEDD